MKACNLVWGHQAVGRQGNFFVGIIVMVIGFLQLFWGVWTFFAYLAVVTGAVFMMMSRLRDFLWRRNYHKLEKYRAPITTQFRDGKIDVVLNGERHEVPWTRFSRYFDTSEFLFLMIDHKNFSIIPKEAFAQTGEVQTVLEMAAARLPRLKKRLL